MIYMRKKGQQKIIISLISLFVVVAVVLSVFQMTGLVNILGSDYGTGRTIDTKAKKYDVSSSGGSIPIDNPYIQTQNQLNHNDLGEIFDSSRYVVSWAPGEYSKAITARVDALFKTRYDTLWSLLYGFGSFPTTFIRNRYAWDVTYTDLSGKSIRVIDGKNFTGGPTGEPNNDVSVKKDYVHIVQGYPARSWPTAAITEERMPTDVAQTGWWAPRDTSASTETVRMETEVFVFEMKGNRVGTLNIKCYLANSAFAHHDSGIFPLQVRWYMLTGPVLLSEDNAYLPSGRGEIRVDSLNAIKTAGSDTSDVTDGTGIVYTKYVFAEGQTVTFSVDTGYSGTALEPGQDGYTEGWRLDVINDKGQTVKTMPIGDGLKNYKVSYTVPAGSFSSTGDNEWMVVLANTLYDQSETRIFVVDTLDKIPGQASAVFDKNQYKQWETVKLSLSAKANPKGTNTIDHFRVWVTYDGWTSTNYALTARNVPATKSGDKYVATVTFQVSLGDKNLYATTVAYDAAQGGRAGPEGEDQAYVEQVIPTGPGGGSAVPGAAGDYSTYIYGIIVAVIVIVVLYAVYYYFKRRRSVKR